MASGDLERLELNHAGARQILTSQEMLDHLLTLGERVAAAASHNKGAVDARPPEYTVEGHIGRQRVRVHISTANDEARAGEARHHWLLTSLDAAR